MNLKKYIHGYLIGKWGFDIEDAALFGNAIWHEVSPGIQGMIDNHESGAFFDWEQVRDSAIRSKRKGATVKMTPIRAVGAYLLNEMLGINEFIDISLTGVEPEINEDVGSGRIVAQDGRTIDQKKYNEMFAQSTFWSGPKTAEGKPLFHYDCEMEVNPPEEMPPFEPDYDEVVAYVPQYVAVRKTEPVPEQPLVTLS